VWFKEMFYRDPDPWQRWLRHRKFWNRWGPILTVAIPVGVAVIVIVELIRGDAL